MLFIYGLDKKRGRGDHKILCNFADGCWWCFRRGHFSGTLDLRKSKKKKLFIISFFLHFFLLLTVILILGNLFCSIFVVLVVLVFHENKLGKHVFVFLFSQNINADFGKAKYSALQFETVRTMENMCRQRKSFWCFINRPLKGIWFSRP